ncbi:hypothetical protein JYU04_02465 [Dehalococcoides mccartyi]|nr:hypothetical protein [Dehalococcoides mccartyi]
MLSFSTSIFHRAGLLVFLTLAASALFVVACGADGFGAESKPSLAATTVAPTFVRIPVTPVPTETPTATPVPIVALNLDSAETGPLEFPLELDPELVSAQPEDEIIFEGWTRYLNNTSIVRRRGEVPMHFCSNGVVMTTEGPNEVFQHWRVTRSPALLASDWGTVGVKVDIISGRWVGREWDVLTLVRKVGEVFITNNPYPGVAEIERSEICLSQVQ